MIESIIALLASPEDNKKFLGLCLLVKSKGQFDVDDVEIATRMIDALGVDFLFRFLKSGKKSGEPIAHKHFALSVMKHFAQYSSIRSRFHPNIALFSEFAEHLEDEFGEEGTLEVPETEFDMDSYRMWLEMLQILVSDEKGFQKCMSVGILSAVISVLYLTRQFKEIDDFRDSLLEFLSECLNRPEAIEAIKTLEMQKFVKLLQVDNPKNMFAVMNLLKTIMDSENAEDIGSSRFCKQEDRWELGLRDILKDHMGSVSDDIRCASFVVCSSLVTKHSSEGLFDGEDGAKFFAMVVRLASEEIKLVLGECELRVTQNNADKLDTSTRTHGIRNHLAQILVACMSIWEFGHETMVKCLDEDESGSFNSSGIVLPEESLVQIFEPMRETTLGILDYLRVLQNNSEKVLSKDCSDGDMCLFDLQWQSHLACCKGLGCWYSLENDPIKEMLPIIPMLLQKSVLGSSAGSPSPVYLSLPLIRELVPIREVRKEFALHGVFTSLFNEVILAVTEQAHQRALEVAMTILCVLEQCSTTQAKKCMANASEPLYENALSCLVDLSIMMQNERNAPFTIPGAVLIRLMVLRTKESVELTRSGRVHSQVCRTIAYITKRIQSVSKSSDEDGNRAIWNGALGQFESVGTQFPWILEAMFG